MTKDWGYINSDPNTDMCYYDNGWYAHDVVDSGFKVSECKRCKCKMIFQDWKWIAVKENVKPEPDDYESRSWMINPFYRITDF